MFSRCVVSFLLLSALLGLSLAESYEDEFYRTISAASPSESDNDSLRDGKSNDSPQRDSWRKIVSDMAAYLKVLGDNSDGIEKSLQELSNKIEKDLDVRAKENYNLWYARKLLNEQRSVIEALQTGVPPAHSKAPSYDELMGQPELYARPTRESTKAQDRIRQREEAPAAGGDQLYEALKNLKNL